MQHPACSQHPHETLPFFSTTAPLALRLTVAISALLRGDPLQRAAHRAEDVSAGAWHGWDVQLSLRVAASPGDGFDQRLIDIKRGKDEILV